MDILLLPSGPDVILGEVGSGFIEVYDLLRDMARYRASKELEIRHGLLKAKGGQVAKSPSSRSDFDHVSTGLRHPHQILTATFKNYNYISDFKLSPTLSPRIYSTICYI